MKASEARAALVARIGRPIAEPTVSDAFRHMFAFYEDTRCEGCSVEEDGDMLLFQWGIFSYDEHPAFLIDLTRQFIEEDADGDQSISQLSMTYFFPVAEGTAAIGGGNQWCATPDELTEFSEFVLGSAAIAYTDRMKPLAAMIEHGDAE